MTDHLDSDHARLELNARGYHYDPVLDPAADRLEQGPGGWKDMPPALLSQASMHKDFRDMYRTAVKAGAIPDDRNAQTYEENR
jgi:hypothetical protein